MMVLKVKQKGTIAFGGVSANFIIKPNEIVLINEEMKIPLTKPYEISVYVEGKLIEHIDSEHE